jgi:hypothetical protein
MSFAVRATYKSRRNQAAAKALDANNAAAAPVNNDNLDDQDNEDIDLDGGILPGNVDLPDGIAQQLSSMGRTGLASLIRDPVAPNTTSLKIAVVPHSMQPARASLSRGFTRTGSMTGHGVRRTASGTVDCL